MAKKKKKAKRKSREQTYEDHQLLVPLDLEAMGTADDPCFGKLFDLTHDACRSCGDSAICSIVLSQMANIQRKTIEAETRFKDIELDQADPNQELKDYLLKLIGKGKKRSLTIIKASKKFDMDKKEVRKIYKAL